MSLISLIGIVAVPDFSTDLFWSYDGECVCEDEEPERRVCRI